MAGQQEINAGTRLGSMILDHFVMSMIAMIFFIPGMIKSFASAFTITHEQTETDLLGGPLLYISLVGFALYFCKDMINGRSAGKRITKTQIIDNKTGQAASPLKCFIRNLFCMIWPVEVVVTLIHPARRIGDLVAGTKVVIYDPVHVAQSQFDIKKSILPFIMSYGLLLLCMLPFKTLMPAFSKVNYMEGSYNDTESKSLEKLFNDSLGQNLTASVKIYDKIPNQHIKYISVIYTLKENYLADETSSKNLRQVTEQLLYSRYPENTFTGQAKYVFRTSGSMQASSNRIGKAPAENNK